MSITRLTMARRFAAAAVAVAVSAGPAHAIIVNVPFTGTLDNVPAELSGTFSVGQTIAGLFSYDSDAVPFDFNAGTNSAVFHALTSLEFEIEGYAASSASSSEIQQDNFPPSNDRFGIVSRASEGLTGPTVSGLGLQAFIFRLDDPTNAAIADAAVLPTSLDFNDFTAGGSFFLFFAESPTADPVLISGTIDALSAVPEPASAALGLAALSALAAALTRRRQTA